MVGAVLSQADVNDEADREDDEESEGKKPRKKITISFSSRIEINKKAEASNH
jgi:hypothetical protein